jgi:hypothetical protein
VSDVHVTLYAKTLAHPEPVPVPVLYRDLNGDGTAYAPVVTTDTTSTGVGVVVTVCAEVIVAATSTVLTPYNATRRNLLIINNSTDPIYIKPDAAATADGNSIKIAGGASYVTDISKSAFNAIVASGTASVTVVRDILA